MYDPDPGGIFASDVHRRVQANIPNPDDDPLPIEGILAQRVTRDDYLNVTATELTDVLRDLEADGHATEAENGWKNTAAGFAALTGPPSREN